MCYPDQWDQDILTHWGRVTHLCVSKLTIIDPDNGLSPGRHQAIIWTNAGIFLIRALKTKFSEFSTKFTQFHSRKCIWKCRLRNGSTFFGFNVLSAMDTRYHFINYILHGMGFITVMHILKEGWRHDLETLSAFLVLCRENTLVLMISPHKGPVMRRLDVFFVLDLGKLLKKQSTCKWFETP